jgi:hypothetical protein
MKHTFFKARHFKATHMGKRPERRKPGHDTVRRFGFVGSKPVNAFSAMWN